MNLKQAILLTGTTFMISSIYHDYIFDARIWSDNFIAYYMLSCVVKHFEVTAFPCNIFPTKWIKQ